MANCGRDRRRGQRLQLDRGWERPRPPRLRAGGQDHAPPQHVKRPPHAREPRLALPPRCPHMAVSACGGGVPPAGLGEGVLVGGDGRGNAVPEGPPTRGVRCTQRAMRWGRWRQTLGPIFRRSFTRGWWSGLLLVIDENYDNPRVQAHAGAALVNFSEDCPKNILGEWLIDWFGSLRHISTERLINASKGNYN